MKKTPTLSSEGQSITPQVFHTSADRARLLRLLWVINQLRPEQVAAVAYFVAQLLREGQR